MSKRAPASGNKSRAADTILLVDPNVLVRMIVGDYLRACGYRVIESVTGEEALTILGAGIKVNAIFAEVKLLGAMDGFALAQKVRGDFPGVEMVLASGVSTMAGKTVDLCDRASRPRPYPLHRLVQRLAKLSEYSK